MPFITQQPFTPHPYEQIREGVLPTIVDESIYQGWVRKFDRNTSMHSERIAYDSAGYNVTGIYLRPVELHKNGHPLIIFNRGGRARYGMLNVLTINNLLSPLVGMNYLVLASQYRGVDGSDGEDEFGGGEVNDVVSLVEYGRKLPEWDGKNIYMFGWSRGGMMTLMALKLGAQVNAIALGAPLIDLTLSTGSKATIKEAWLNRVLPNYKTEGFAALESRSAPYWLNKLNETPTLLMHGDGDKDVSIMHSRQFVQKLREHDITTKLVEYENGNHYLNRQRNEVMQEVDSWFDHYKA